MTTRQLNRHTFLFEDHSLKIGAQQPASRLPAGVAGVSAGHFPCHFQDSVSAPAPCTEGKRPQVREDPQLPSATNSTQKTYTKYPTAWSHLRIRRSKERSSPGNTRFQLSPLTMESGPMPKNSTRETPGPRSPAGSNQRQTRRLPV
jgi:hypothetical protein